MIRNSKPESASSPISELAEILAAGVSRMLAPQSSDKSPDSGEFSLDIPVPQSGHPAPEDWRMSDG
jgi:hypothetical protein